MKTLEFVYPIQLAFMSGVPGAPRLIEPGQRIEVDDDAAALLLQQDEHWMMAEPEKPVDVPEVPEPPPAYHAETADQSVEEQAGLPPEPVHYGEIEPAGAEPAPSHE